MKVGIITFHSAHNYGASLQTWAMQEFLKAHGMTPEVINYRNNRIDKAYRINKKTTDASMIKRYNSFEAFIAKELPLSACYKTLQELKNAEFDYDAVIAGSDQIWNSGILGGLNSAYFCDFGEPFMKRISYAASIGSDELPEGTGVLFRHHLKYLDSVSVRESKAKEMLESLTQKEISVVIDPTLLIAKDNYDRICVPSDFGQPYIYLHNVHITGEYEALNAMAEKLSKQLGLPIVKNRDEKLFDNELKPFTTGGPKEFLGMISGAAYVVTDSFHATVFSILYHKNFITVPPIKRPDRLYHLLGSLGLNSHLIESKSLLPPLESLAIDYELIEQKLTTLRSSSVDFLLNALKKESEKNTSLYFDTDDKFQCYGCGACAQVCPVNAVTMTTDRFGFSYPVISKDLCIHCNSCRTVCIEQKPQLYNTSNPGSPSYYEVYHNDLYTRMISMEGGLLPALCKAVLTLGGTIAGTAFDSSKQAVVYKLANTLEDCSDFFELKCLEPETDTLLKQMKVLIDLGKFILFIGTPCQIASIKSYFNGTVPNLYCVEKACNGYMSPKVFKAYADTLSETYGAPLSTFNFRAKKNGKEKVQVTFDFANGEHFGEIYATNKLYRAYNASALQRPSCYTCNFRSSQHGVGDLSIGPVSPRLLTDFNNDDRSVSIITLYTTKGNELWNLIKSSTVHKSLSYSEAVELLPVNPLTLTSARVRLLNGLETTPIAKLLRPFASKPKKK